MPGPNKPLRFARSRRDGFTVTAFSGALTEHSGETLATAEPNIGDNCVLDLFGISAVNSCGIFEWTRFLNRLGRHRVIVLERCSLATVKVMNLLPAFTAGATVRSVVVPWECSGCPERGGEVVQLADLRGATPALPLCPRCRSPVEAAVDVLDYLSFCRPESSS